MKIRSFLKIILLLMLVSLNNATFAQQKKKSKKKTTIVKKAIKKKKNVQNGEKGVVEPQKSYNIVPEKTKETTCEFPNSDVDPEYLGGVNEFRQYIARNFQISEEQISGSRITMVISFIVEIDGTLSEIKCNNSPSLACCNEAIRVVKGSKRWKPGICKGNPVRTRFRMPITVITE